MPDRWTTRVWSAEEQLALAGLGPAWRLARKATGQVDCPTCLSPVWTPCPGGLHPDRLFACTAHLRAVKMTPPAADAVRAVSRIVHAFDLKAGSVILRAAVEDDDAFNLAIHHGLLRLKTHREPLTLRERWVLSDYGAACWCQT